MGPRCLCGETPSLLALEKVKQEENYPLSQQSLQLPNLSASQTDIVNEIAHTRRGMCRSFYLPAVKMLLHLTELHHGFPFHKSPAQEDYLESLVTALWALGLHQHVTVSINAAGALSPNPSPPSSARHSEVTSPGSAGAAAAGQSPGWRGLAAPGGPGEGMGDSAGGTVRRCRGRRFLPPPGRAGPVPPSRVREGGTGTHLAPSGTGPGWSRLPGAGRGPRPARARSPRRSLRCQQTSRHFLRPRRKRHRVLPRKHRRGRNARSAGTRRGRGRSVTSQGRDGTRRRD